jgi:hypothetical protein
MVTSSNEPENELTDSISPLFLFAACGELGESSSMTSVSFIRLRFRLFWLLDGVPHDRNSSALGYKLFHWGGICLINCAIALMQNNVDILKYTIAKHEQRVQYTLYTI